LLEKAVSEIKKAEYVIALTGAGVSAESDIPTFRGKDGLWNKYRPEELATPEAFRRDPKLVWEWYSWRMRLVFSKNPNPAHFALAELEKTGILKCLITQNVDDLHERAGSSKVIHLHGSLRLIKCSNPACGYHADSSTYVESSSIQVGKLPECPVCSSLLRPGVVWFGERLPPDILIRSFEEAEKSDLVLVIGTSAVVQPAASIPLITKKKGGKIIEINPDSTPLTSVSDISIRMPAGEALSKIVEIAKNQS